MTQESLIEYVTKLNSWTKIYREDVGKKLPAYDERMKLSESKVKEMSSTTYNIFLTRRRNFKAGSLTNGMFCQQLQPFLLLFQNDELLYYPTLHISDIKKTLDKYLPRQELQQAA